MGRLRLCGFVALIILFITTDVVTGQTSKNPDQLMPANVFRSQIAVTSLCDFYKSAEVKAIVSFTFSVKTKRGDLVGPYTVNGSPLFSKNPHIVEIMQKLMPGDIVYIEDVRAIGPDKRIRPINSVILTLN